MKAFSYPLFSVVFLPACALLASAVCLGLAPAAQATEIATAADFVAIANDPAGSYTLTADIDLTGAGYVTIPFFYGTLNGDGHKLTGLGAQTLFTTNSGTIANLTLDGTVDGANTVRTAQAVGMFCNRLVGGSFTDCVIKGYTLRSSAQTCNLGLFAGFAYEGSSFTRCMTDASCELDPRNPNVHIGAFVGTVNCVNKDNIIAVFSDCTNNAPMTVATGDYNSSFGKGGFVGSISGLSASNIPEVHFIRCVNNADIFSAKNYTNAGGFVGLFDSGTQSSRTVSSRLRFINCVNNGTISLTSGSSCAGGFAGTCTGSPTITIRNCVNRGTIDCGTANPAGGFVGQRTGYAADIGDGLTILNCANYADVTGGTAGGMVGSISFNTGWNNGKIAIRNSATYGTVTGSSNKGELVGKMTTGTGANVVITFDNDWTPSATLYASSSKTPTVSNMQNANTPDSDALAALNAVVANETSYMSWAIGSTTHPELGVFAAVSSPYTVVFFDWDGTVLKQETVASGGAATAPANPSRDAFQFAGWTPAFGNVTAPLAVFAVYAPISYTFTFDSAGGSACETITGPYGKGVMLPTPTRANYIFAGWSENMVVKKFSTIPDRDVSLKAVWMPEKEPSSRRRSVLQWRVKDTNSSTRGAPIASLMTELEALHPDFVIISGFDSKAGFLEAINAAAEAKGYAFSYTTGNGSADGGTRVFGWKSAKFEAGNVVQQLGVPVSNSSTGYQPLHEIGTDNYFVLFCGYYSTTKTLADYLNAVGNIFTTPRKNFPSATFVLGADYTKFPNSPVYESTYHSDYTEVLPVYKQNSGLTEIQAGDDLLWTFVGSPYDPFTLRVVSVTTRTNDTLAGSNPGYFSVFTLGKEGATSVYIK